MELTDKRAQQVIAGIGRVLDLDVLLPHQEANLRDAATLVRQLLAVRKALREELRLRPPSERAVIRSLVVRLMHAAGMPEGGRDESQA